MDSFGKYQLIRRLGSGGMAEVFLAREPLAQGLAKILVIKKIHPQLAEAPQFRQMFEDEAKVAVNLNHPNIVQTFGYGQLGPTYYLAMEHVEGVDLLRLLNAALQAGSRVPFGLCAYVCQQVAKGLDYAHRKADEYGAPLGIVHRDVSPQNILVSFDGAVKLVDFGIARARTSHNDDGAIKGKFAYMSPEQAVGAPVDLRSDVFSTGIVLWELACGRTLFGDLKGDKARSAVKNAQVPRPRDVDPEVPPELETIILKALARHPEDRYQTARDLHRALGRFFFERSAQEGEIFDSGMLASFLAQLCPREPLQRPPLADEATPAKPPSPALEKVMAGGWQLSDTLLQHSERRYVVVVEGELEGLAAVRRQVGEVRAREALLDFLRMTEHVAYKHGAHPDRLDERGFTYVLGLPLSSEHDSARAIEFGLALGEALDGICREIDPPLKLSVGIQRGVALVSRAAGRAPSIKFEYELLGQTAQVARRLAAEAMPGEILVGGGVFRGVRAEWRFEELDALELPLDPETLPGGTDAGERTASRAKVYRLMGARPRAERLADRGGAPRLYGRSLEVGTLETTHRAALELHQSRHVLLLGEAGVGKSSIVDAFRRGLDPDVHLVLRAVGRPAMRETPYAILADLVRDLLRVSEEAEPRELKRRIESTAQLLFRPEEVRQAQQAIDALALLLGVKVATAEELDPGERRHRLHAALRRLELRLSEERALVIVIEDLHWADSQSFEILAALIRESMDRPLFGIVTARHDERSEELARDPRLTTILVGELGLREREEMVLSRFLPDGSAETRELVQMILDRAGGNPFYIHEIIESLVERGILAAASGGAEDERRLRWMRRDEIITVPTTVEAVVASRLDRLPDEERDAIRRAGLLGRSFRIDDLAALTGADPIAALHCLEARGLITRESETDEVYSFRNLITREVAYDGLAPDTRALLHSVAADRLRHSPRYRPGADDARLAIHLEAAGDHPAAARALISAGLYARDSAGNAEAFRLFTRALSLLPLDALTERYEALKEREQILRGLGRRTAQLREVHAMRKVAQALGDARREAETFCRLGLLYLDAGKHAAARRELERALERALKAGDAAVESEALRLQAGLLMTIGKNSEALTLALRALTVLEARASSASGTRVTAIARAQALNAVGSVHVHTGHLHEAVSSYAEALVIYRKLGARRLEAATLNNMGWVFVGLGEYEEALIHYKRSLRLAQELGDRAGVGVKLANIGQTYADLGDLARARRYLDKALELDRALNDDSGLADALISLAQVDLRENKLSDAALRLERGLELAAATGTRYQEIRALVYLAFCRVQSGAPADGALELAESATRLAREAGIANGEVYGLAAEAAALTALGKAAEGLARSSEAVTLLDSGRDVDSPEEVLALHARVANAAGQPEIARAALRRAFIEVQRKASLLHDLTWRARYLDAPLARAILAEARAAGADELSN